MSETAFDMRLAQAGLVVDPQTARIPVAFGGATYAIEAHETGDGCLLRCDVESPGTSMAKYADALNQIGHGEPGETEVVIAPNRLTVVRHLHNTTSDDLRSAALRIAGMTQMAAEIVAMLRTADAVEERLAEAPRGKFPDLQPALEALGTAPAAGATTVGPLQATAQVSPDGKWWWNGKQWVVMPPVQASPHRELPVVGVNQEPLRTSEQVAEPAQPEPVVASGPQAAALSQEPVMVSEPRAAAMNKKRSKRPWYVLAGIAVAVVVAVVILEVTGKFSPTPSNNGADSGLGVGPYYLHFNCGGDATCKTLGYNELTAKGGNTGIFVDFPDLASCQKEVTTDAGLKNKEWCSKSKNPLDTKA